MALTRAQADAKEALIRRLRPSLWLTEHANFILFRLDEARQQSGWQPIETAPKNVSVLIYIPNAEHYGPGIYRGMLVDMGTGPHWSANAVAMGRDLGRDTMPTHWMPLPSPPEGT